MLAVVMYVASPVLADKAKDDQNSHRGKVVSVEGNKLTMVPVDIRHNAKIFREKLTVWAAKKLRA
jgi:hypothetical protein